MDQGQKGHLMLECSNNPKFFLYKKQERKLPIQAYKCFSHSCWVRFK